MLQALGERCRYVGRGAIEDRSLVAISYTAAVGLSTLGLDTGALGCVLWS